MAQLSTTVAVGAVRGDAPTTDRAPVKRSNVLYGLSWLIAGLAAVAASSGLVWPGAGAPVVFTTVRGQAVQLAGHGLYRYDTVFAAAGQHGSDVVTLLLGMPLLIVTVRLYRRGSTRAALLLTGTLAYFLYSYGSAALGTVAYNPLFLLYVALFSASLFAFLMAFTSIDAAALGFVDRVPRRGPAVFMVVSGLVLFAVWAVPAIVAAMRGQVPERLDSYSTLVTHALDLGIIMPATIVAAVLILRRRPLGYLVALSMLVLEVMLAPLITAQTISQLAAGVRFPPGQIVGPIAGFGILAVAAIWVLVAILRAVVTDRRPGRSA